MFNLGSGLKTEIVLMALVGFGLFAKKNDIDLSNNTSILLIALILFFEQEQIRELKREVHGHHGQRAQFPHTVNRFNTGGGCPCHNRHW